MSLLLFLVLTEEHFEIILEPFLKSVCPPILCDFDHFILDFFKLFEQFLVLFQNVFTRKFLSHPCQITKMGFSMLLYLLQFLFFDFLILLNVFFMKQQNINFLCRIWKNESVLA